MGNSITQGWGGNRKEVTYKPGKEAMDNAIGKDNWESAGISGDRTQNLLWRVRYDNYNSCHPENIVIAIGINNLISGKDSPSFGSIRLPNGIHFPVQDAHTYFPPCS